MIIASWKNDTDVYSRIWDMQDNGRSSRYVEQIEWLLVESEHSLQSRGGV